MQLIDFSGIISIREKQREIHRKEKNQEDV